MTSNSCWFRWGWSHWWWFDTLVMSLHGSQDSYNPKERSAFIEIKGLQAGVLDVFGPFRDQLILISLWSRLQKVICKVLPDHNHSDFMAYDNTSCGQVRLLDLDLVVSRRFRCSIMLQDLVRTMYPHLLLQHLFHKLKRRMYLGVYKHIPQT